MAKLTMMLNSQINNLSMNPFDFGSEIMSIIPAIDGLFSHAYINSEWQEQQISYHRNHNYNNTL